MTYMDGGNTGSEGTPTRMWVVESRQERRPNNWQQEIDGLFQTIFRVVGFCARQNQSTPLIQ